MNQPQSKIIFPALAAGFLLALLLFSWMAAFDPGITWDEPAYVAAGYSHVRWLAHLSSDSFGYQQIDEAWRLNHEHPPLPKLAYGIAAVLEGGETMPALISARMAASLIFVALVGLVLFFTAAHYGKPAGVIAAVSLVLMPRVFGHGHLAGLDVPVAFFCFLATILFADFKKSRGRPVWAGIIWGLALLSKVSAVFVPVIIIPWAIWRAGRKALIPCAVFLVLGVAVFFAGWPWLWHDTAHRVHTYIINKVERFDSAEHAPGITGTTNVPVHYLGTTYKNNDAPWHYPFVLTLVTVPVAIIVLGRLGAAKAPKEKRHITALIIASAAVNIGVFALPGIPKYDGVRLMMPAFPFIACLAGIGGAWLWNRGVAWKVAVALVFALDLALLVHAHPYELSYYNLAIGGARGAQKLGFETTYWGDTVTRDAVEEINRVARGSTVGFRPRHLEFLPWGDASIRVAPNPQYLIVFPRQGYLDEQTRLLIREQAPLREWKYFGVTQCMLYRMAALNR